MSMIRIIMRGQLQEGREEDGTAALKRAGEITVKPFIDNHSLMTAAAFRWERNVFLYYECTGVRIEPETMFPEMGVYLEDWPGHAVKRKWIPMIDVFHFNEPADNAHWARNDAVERRVGRVAHLRPEKVSSYIYYHYQLQEERAFLGPKYEIISMHENLLFGYQEFPAVVEEPVLPRKLETTGTPKDWNDSRMDLHFQPWEDGHLYFKPVETLFALY